MSFPLTSVMPQSQNYLQQLGTAASGTNPMAGILNTDPTSLLNTTSQTQNQTSQTNGTTQQPDLQQVLSLLAILLMDMLTQQQSPATTGEDPTDGGGGVEPMSAPMASAAPQSFAAPAETQAPQNTAPAETQNSVAPETTGTQGSGIHNLSTGKDGAALDNSLNKIANDPDGAKLIAAAKEKGISIEVGDPAAAAGSADKVKDKVTDKAKDGTTTVNGVTLTDADGNTKIVVRDPNNIKTIAHELVHAVSTGDGDSKQEEGIADVIGSRIANRIGGPDSGGLSGSDEQIYENKQQYYPSLQQSNDIRNTMASLGIALTV